MGRGGVRAAYGVVVVRFPDLPTAADRLSAASATGTVERLAVGRDVDVPEDQAVAELTAITTDPRVLGHVLGAYLARAELGVGDWSRAVRLLRAAGADEATAAVMVEWQRERYARHGGLLP